LPATKLLRRALAHGRAHRFFGVAKKMIHADIKGNGIILKHAEKFGGEYVSSKRSARKKTGEMQNATEEKFYNCLFECDSGEIIMIQINL